MLQYEENEITQNISSEIPLERLIIDLSARLSVLPLQIRQKLLEGEEEIW